MAFKTDTFSPDSAYRFMEKLARDIGNRESGTDSERRAAQQIKAWFEEFGLAHVRMEEFEVQTSRISKEEASLPDGTKLHCSAVGNTQSTPDEGVEGEVVFLESTSSEALRGIKNKIAVLGLVLYKESFKRVLDAQPLALIYPSKTPFAPGIYRSVRAEYTEKQNTTAISLAHDDALRILKGPRKLKIVTKVKKITAKSQNVLGDIPGVIEDEPVLVGGHYDTVRKVMGAHDNAAGTAMTLELARIFSHEKIKRTLRLAAFGSEELGLRGSSNYAERSENVQNLRLCLDFDVHGILIGSLNAVVLGPHDLKSFLKFTAKELGIPLQMTSELTPGVGSDHMPLAFHGVPSIELSRHGGAAGVMHTDIEDLRWCGKDAFTSAGRLSQAALERLLKAEEFPFERKIPKEIAQALRRRFGDMGINKTSNPENE